MGWLALYGKHKGVSVQMGGELPCEPPVNIIAMFMMKSMENTTVNS